MSPSDKKLQKWMILLRAVNVSGKNIIKMEKLRELLGKAGFKNVKTYIQSGNIVLESDIDNPDTLAKNIENLIETNFGYQVPAIVRSEEVYSALIKNNPFKEHSFAENEKLYVSFLKNSPSDADIKIVEAYSNEKEVFKVLGSQIYVVCVKDGSKLQFSNAFLEKKLKIAATTRNWASVNKIFNL